MHNFHSQSQVFNTQRHTSRVSARS